MADLPTLGIVGGTGWLGSAIARALIEGEHILPEHLFVSARNRPSTEDNLGVFCSSNQELAGRSEIVILSVRPEQIQNVDVDLEGKLVISLLAGVTSADIANFTGARRLIRAMPNAAAEIRQSYTPWFASGEVSSDDRRFAKIIFNAIGLADEVFVEAHIDYFCGLTGSGPAFPALLADAMLEHALKRGISPDVARRGVMSVIAGGGRMLALGEAMPKTVIERLISYRGTTAAALEAMEDGGFRNSVRRGLDAAERRATEMHKRD